MYRVEWEYNNLCGNLSFEDMEEALKFAEEIGGKITITRE